jgi:ketosteroid isomerase-like protein
MTLAVVGFVLALGCTVRDAGDAAETADPAGEPRGVSSPGDSVAVVATAERFHRALSSGDSAAALTLLTPDAVIVESGRVESRDEHRAHHLPADLAFARAVRSVRQLVRVAVQGDLAWIASRSTTRGEFRGRPVNSAGAELMVLRRTSDGWHIAATHWSSRREGS